MDTLLAQEIYRTAHLTGSFRLRSGKVSTDYFDKYMFESDPGLLNRITDRLLPLIPDNTELLAGLELGGIPIATALSLKTGIPVLFVRKKAKEYGTCKLAEGMPLAGKNVCIIEDVVTTGGQIVLSADDMRALGAQVAHAVCVIQREDAAQAHLSANGLQLTALFTFEDLMLAFN
ncbi:orotate phosphoribosyltransferase [Paenibacillus thalictri]|uniref:Orotate phosphoribosyltransferase n=1 Tax=Paenibacillus thalictri TaxID=2527873 RepID=A0A4Q9DVM6_9BACL|nr:orotate phosphoribosyltransferase [Paenibacillus thalictri]TBL80415.1 orotate phosphoribosyltransferase [Paenibacillus thalictri]